MSVDYLKVPTNEFVASSRPYRTTSFTEKSNPYDECTVSNLSLPTPRSSILKRTNSSHMQQSTSSHSNVHYTPISNEDNKNCLPSSTTPIIQSPPLVTHKSSGTHYHSFRNRQLLYKPTIPHSSSHRRSNDENADAYKMLSILYGLVTFIGGVALSISNAIIPIDEVGNIKHFVEMYYTYLYCVSIIWIVFCIFDITHHHRKLKSDDKKSKHADEEQMPIRSGNLHLFKIKPRSPSTNDPMTNSSTTPHFNLQLFDDSDEFQSDDEQKKNNSVKLLNVDDDEDDEGDREEDNIHLTRSKSLSLGNLSTKSSMLIRRNLYVRRAAMDPGEMHHLRNYVQHRKDSIVQRVIGYNYDDHSTAGGLYIRVGIGIFCLGTVIHSGLSILSNLEYPPCAQWTAVMEDGSRLLFSFIQFFFIFKHSNLIIRAHESLARLAVMHVVVTNLCVWFRMVVIETTSQILETRMHEMHLEQTTGGNSFSGSTNFINPNHRSSIHIHNCPKLIDDAEEMTASISDGYMRLKPLLYPCTIEFSLMCLTLFYLIWENIGKTFAHKISDKASTKNVFMVNCHASIKGLFGGMIVFSCTVTSIILYSVFRNRIGDDLHSLTTLNISPHHRVHSRDVTIESILFNTSSIDSHHLPTSIRSTSKTSKTTLVSIAIVEIVNLSLLIISLLATTTALIKIRKFQYRRTTTRFDDVLIIVSLTGTYLYSIFSAFALLNTKIHKTWIVYLKIVIVFLDFIEGTVHAFFILVALRKRLPRTKTIEYPAREIITLLIMLDLSLWFEETTTTTKHEANPFQLAFYHNIPWSIIAAIATPLQIFFRFHASVCLSHVWENMYVLPTYEPVAPHGL